MTQPVRSPESPEEPTGGYEIPPAGASDEELLKALVAALVAGAALEVIATILGRFEGLSRKVVLQIVLELSLDAVISTAAEELALLPRTGEPAVRVLRQTAIANAFRRAAYLVNAARRMTPAVASGDPNEIATARKREEQFLLAHQEMERRRNEAGRQVAEAVEGLAPNEKGEILLGWRSRRTNRTCPTCRKAHGRNFNALVRPKIGYPGEVHLWCECKPRKPWDTRLRVESSAVPEHR